MSESEPDIEKDASYILAGDIGGTKTNLGIFTRGKKRPAVKLIETFSSRDVDGIEDIIREFITRHPAAISCACFGVAGPVIEGKVDATNLPWVLSEQSLRRQFGWNRVKLINDLSATALAIPMLKSGELSPLNHVPSQKPGNIGLVAPGTGLGEALLICLEDRYLPIASEAGHADFAPSDEKDLDLWRYLHGIYGHVSVERVLSGQGLIDIYDWLKSGATLRESQMVRAAMQSSDSAKIISEHAIDGDDRLCKTALQRYCRILGAVAGNLALTGMTSGGMFLGGGIPAKILPALREGHFMASFNAKGRFASYMKKIPVWVIENDKTALLGAAQQALLLS